jgi:hypothetical protein
MMGACADVDMCVKQAVPDRVIYRMRSGSTHAEAMSVMLADGSIWYAGAQYKGVAEWLRTCFNKRVSR